MVGTAATLPWPEHRRVCIQPLPPVLVCKPEAEDKGTHKAPHQSNLAVSQVEGDRGPGQGGWGLDGSELFPGSNGRQDCV